MSDRNPQQQSRLPGMWTLVRDMGSFLGGWVLIFLEVSRPEVRDAVLILGGSLVGVPVAAVGVSSIAEAVGARRNGTNGQPQSSPEEASSSRPQSP